MANVADGRPILKNPLRFSPGELGAFTVTPFVAAGLWYLWMLGMLLVWNGRLRWGPDVVAMLIGACTYGLFVAFAITYLVAVPCYLLLRAVVEINGLLVRSAGAAIGALVGAGLAYLVMHPGPIGGGVIGWAVAAIWWRTAHGALDVRADG